MEEPSRVYRENRRPSTKHLTGGREASKGGKTKSPRVSWKPKQEGVMR